MGVSNEKRCNIVDIIALDDSTESITITLNLDEIRMQPGRVFFIKSANSIRSYTKPVSLTIISKERTDILPETFKDCKKLKSVYLSKCERFDTMGGNAFENCTDLVSVKFPNTLLIIESEAFKGCGLTSVDLSDSKVRTIQQNVFSDCAQLESVNLSGCLHLEEIQRQAFYNCPLKIVDLSGCINLSTIEKYAFGSMKIVGGLIKENNKLKMDTKNMNSLLNVVATIATISTIGLCIKMINHK